MSRFEEVVNEAIGEVVLSESPFRAETLARHIAELVRERQGAERAEVSDRGALSRAQARARIGHPDAGDLHAARPGGRLRARHRAASSAYRSGRHDRMPVRAGDGRASTRCTNSHDARASAKPKPSARVSRRATRCDPQPARAGDAADRLHRGLRRGDRRDDAAGDRRGEHVLGDLRADEALGRGRGRRKGAPPPALRQDCAAARWSPAWWPAFPGLEGASFVSARQENLETIHQHNVVAERHGLLSELRGELEIPTPARAPDEPRGVARRRACAVSAGAGLRRCIRRRSPKK